MNLANMFIHEDDDMHSELNLELCLGMKPRISVHDRTRGVEDEKEIAMVEDNLTSPKVSLKACDRQYNTESNQNIGEMNDSFNVLPSVADVYAKKEDTAELVRSVSYETEQHVASQQRRREIHDQKRPTEKKKRKELKAEEKQQKLSKMSKPSLAPSRYLNASSCSRKVEKDHIKSYQKKRAAEQSLDQKGSCNSSLTSQIQKTKKEQEFVQEERAQFQNIQRNTQREQHRATTDNERMLGSRPEEDTLTETCSDNKSSQPTEDQNKPDRAPLIQSFLERSSTINCRNADQVDNFIKKPEIGVHGIVEETAKDLKPLKETAGVDVGDADAPLTLPSLPATAAASFIQNPFGIPMYFPNVRAVPYRMPYFIPDIAAHSLGPYGESSCISYPYSVTSAFRTPTTLTASTSQTPIFRPSAVRHSQKRKSPTSSCHEEKHCKGGAKSKETPKSPVLSKPPLSEDISSESKGRSWVDQADSHALSTSSSSTLGEEAAAASGPELSGKSSTLSGVYPSAHGETAESYPTIKNCDHTIQGNRQETAAHGADCNIQGAAAAAAAGHVRFPLACGPVVCTTVNGNTTVGFLFPYSKGDVRICCKCHGERMTAGEFVVHAGGVDGPHPERSIVVKFPV